MNIPYITDDDEGFIIAELPTRQVRSWGYEDRKEQRVKMLMAREFVEGWYQALKAYGVPERDMSEFEGR